MGTSSSASTLVRRCPDPRMSFCAGRRHTSLHSLIGSSSPVGGGASVPEILSSPPGSSWSCKPPLRWNMAASQPDPEHSPPLDRPAPLLEQNPAALANLLTNLVVGVVVLDDASEVLYCNVLAGDLLGVDPRSCLGR